MACTIDGATYLNKADLKRRGWFVGQIKGLGEPDKLAPNPYHPEQPQCLYLLSRVEATEKTDGFKRSIALGKKLSGIHKARHSGRDFYEDCKRNSPDLPIALVSTRQQLHDYARELGFTVEEPPAGPDKFTLPNGKTLFGPGKNCSAAACGTVADRLRLAVDQANERGDLL